MTTFHPDTLSALRDTPRVVVDQARLQANIAAVQAKAERRGVRLRPHVKTHKCPDIAALQLAAGAVGLTASKVDEALAFLASGAPSVTVAYPLLHAAKLDRLLAGVGRAELRVIADSMHGAQALAQAARRHGTTLAVLLKVDVGLHRCGLEPRDPRLVDLARFVGKSPGLKLAGVLSHAGHAYAARDAAEAWRMAREEAEAMALAKELLEDAGLPAREVSVGATPTVLAAPDFGPATEIRPGNYVFMDRTCVRLGLAQPEDCALFVAASVVSTNNRFAILDAGSKTLSSDTGAHGSGGPGGFGLAWPLEDDACQATPLAVEKLSEEHGFLRLDPEAGWSPRPGHTVRVLPNHACPVANLADKLLVVRPDGAHVFWNVAARGAVR